MLSTDYLETLIASKKREIEKEKTLLGIGPPRRISHIEEYKENDQFQVNPKKQVNFRQNQSEISKERRILSEQQQQNESIQTEDTQKDLYDLEEKIPPDLERYIRRYIGIPAMLKAGEYSPNNPILRAELNAERGGDALLGLGEYERRRNTLRKIRQSQYRQYLDQQAKKNQEAKEQAERERREREEKERQREERERQLLLERDRYSPERRRASVCTVPVSNALVHTTKVDTGVQVDGLTSPLSVAVQTDDAELYRMSPSPSPVKCLTQAERELSPRTVGDTKHGWPHAWDAGERRRSYGDFDERTSTVKQSNRDKLVSDLRHSYMPSIFDADAIHMRNLQAEKEAAARRRFYQQELKNQILEQQRIREERKSREKMLEQAEMRRLEDQLRMLRVAQEREVDKQHDISTAMKDDAKAYDEKRTELQREIDMEQQKLLRATAQPTRHATRHATTRHNTSKSDTPRSKLPFFYNSEKAYQQTENQVQKPYSFNIPDNSVFSANYDVDTYLRKNLNFRDKIELDIENIGNNNPPASSVSKNNNIVIEKALIHEPKVRPQKSYAVQGTKENTEKNYAIQGNKEKQEKSYGFQESKENLEKMYSVQGTKEKPEKSYAVQGSKENTDKSYAVQGTKENTDKSYAVQGTKENTDKSYAVQGTKENTERTYAVQGTKENTERTYAGKETKDKPERSYYDVDNISIPVLRHSPRTKQLSTDNNSNLSDAMKKVDDKWKVPAVQKNILKSLPNDHGRNVNILTQLGSIRRQLQLEQLKLDKMLIKES